jgi:Single Cache domain 2
MASRHSIGAVSIAAGVFCATASAQQAPFGTAEEARAMLGRAIAAVKTNKGGALATFNTGGTGFKDRDLYPFCFNLSDGTFVAGIKELLGTDTRMLKDPAGKPFGQDIYAAAQKPEGEITEVSYKFPRPGPDKTPVPKITFVARAGDLGCGVGYYK